MRYECQCDKLTPSINVQKVNNYSSKYGLCTDRTTVTTCYKGPYNDLCKTVRTKKLTVESM